ncbi:2584_t:CDS:2 [Gigaspora margarita]|uniref:2584_t:CDS:1 n=1 Tax=Gigaspora margarita TaxID=4874 RepID=A0ABN7VPI4_GIGMA|nr:2584_t:CDS:2 [Gigaspora margarita]
MAANDVLNAAAEAMTTLANAIGSGDEKFLLKIDFYCELACTYIKDNAQE